MLEFLVDLGFGRRSLRLGPSVGGDIYRFGSLS